MAAAARIACGVVLAAIISQTHPRPDFSGIWKPVETESPTPAPPPQTPGGPPPPPRGISTTITQSPAEIRIDRRLESGGRETVQTFVYKLDGTESVNQMGPMVFRTKAHWESSSLVLSSMLSMEGKPFGEAKEIYRLENGDLVVETTRKVPAGTFTGKGVLRKAG